MKAFKIKNGLSAKRYLGNSTTLSGSTIDLSLGSMFSTTLSSDPAYTFTNPPASGNAQAFSVEVTGGTTTFTNDAFATSLYAGTGSAQTITNGIDLAGSGGLVWTKSRTNTYNNTIGDTESGTGLYLYTNTTAPHTTPTDAYISAYNSNGYDIGSVGGGYVAGELGASGQNYVSWTFKKKAKFFDIVEYSGNSTQGRTVSHTFGSTPGLIIIKSTTKADSWYVLHKDSELLALNNTQGNYPSSTTRDYFGDGTNTIRPTGTQFTVGSDSGINGSGHDYIAYIFGHDTSDDSLIKCGSYTKTGSSQDIDLGWSPEWLMLKRVSSTSSWYIMDTKRGFATDANPVTLKAEAVDAEGGLANVRRTSTGFNVTSDAGEEWVYMAIRASAATDSAITWPSSVKWPSGVAPTTPAPGTKDLFTFLTTDGGTTYYGKKAAEGLA
jgi:hypothetical protein